MRDIAGVWAPPIAQQRGAEVEGVMQAEDEAEEGLGKVEAGEEEEGGELNGGCCVDRGS